MSHRFVTVRRGSPAARSGQIRPGDRLEAVEGRPVAALQHRDLAQILRRAGNTLRLGVARSTTHTHAVCGCHSNSRFHPENLLGLVVGRSAVMFLSLKLTGNLRISLDNYVLLNINTRFYSVDLERGPTGFGFSLRGGSEYNMGLYVLGLMDGGPAQRSCKIQLVEINGGSTAGMTHSQAVEQIRRGGNRIHLVLKKGNGYVPDYGETPDSSFLEVSQSAASMAPMERSDWRREPGSGRDLWLKPSPQRQTQVLIGCRRSGRDLADELSL
uniref:PDZ domain-containing protein n=1 Tax=Poecilia latipinna TaxID=48699 RepID=A0A3B3TKQ9_9TELE